MSKFILAFLVLVFMVSSLVQANPNHAAEGLAERQLAPVQSVERLLLGLTIEATPMMPIAQASGRFGFFQSGVPPFLSGARVNLERPFCRVEWVARRTPVTFRAIPVGRHAIRTAVPVSEPGTGGSFNGVVMTFEAAVVGGSQVAEIKCMRWTPAGRLVRPLTLLDIFAAFDDGRIHPGYLHFQRR